ncbi:TPA: hypothetical protein ACXJNB_000011 [Serratia marcescens]
MMKKIAYITLLDTSAKSNGVNKKIFAQCKAFIHLGYDVDIFSMTSYGLMKTNLITGEFHEEKLSKRRNVFFYNEVIHYLSGRDDDYHMVYLRQPFPTIRSIGFSNFIKKIKLKAKKIVLEMPTYPFLNESKNLKEKLYNFLFRWQFSTSKKNIDLIVYMGAFTKEIWGVKALRIFNSVDISQNPMIKNCFSKTVNDEPIRLIGVAQLAFWHGYDRIITGLAEYYKNSSNSKAVYFDIVGNSDFGGAESELKALVDKLNLRKYVIFHGPQHGDALTKIFESSNIAVDSLGRHRSNNEYNCSLKSKEYCARGLPFVKSHKDDAFEGTNYFYQVPPDESAIDISELLNWYKRVDFDPNEMRCFVENELVWEVQMEKVISALS